MLSVQKVERIQDISTNSTDYNFSFAIYTYTKKKSDCRSDNANWKYSPGRFAQVQVPHWLGLLLHFLFKNLAVDDEMLSFIHYEATCSFLPSHKKPSDLVGTWESGLEERFYTLILLPPWDAVPCNDGHSLQSLLSAATSPLSSNKPSSWWISTFILNSRKIRLIPIPCKLFSSQVFTSMK